ncbi:MAG: hypothetical protein LBT38_11695, partial [Deltaproteobacteria bacterium]|nr:hypothetical protein [Deltaproteobacteria bacterium]
MKRFLLTILFLALGCLMGSDALLAQTAQSQPLSPDSFGKVLIVYFSQTGNTEKLANIIKSQVNGDVLRLETAKELPAQPQELIDTIRAILQNPNAKLEVKTAVPDLQAYDVIFFGGPVWAGRPSLPLMDMAEKIDFQGKKVIIFGTYGRDPRQAYSVLEKALKNAKVIEGGKIFDKNILQAEEPGQIVGQWLAGLL